MTSNLPDEKHGEGVLANSPIGEDVSDVRLSNRHLQLQIPGNPLQLLAKPRPVEPQGVVGGDLDHDLLGPLQLPLGDQPPHGLRHDPVSKNQLRKCQDDVLLFRSTRGGEAGVILSWANSVRYGDDSNLLFEQDS